MEFGGFELLERERDFECPGLFMPVIGCSEQPVIPSHLASPTPYTHTHTVTGTFRPINCTTLWYVKAKTTFTKQKSTYFLWLTPISNCKFTWRAWRFNGHVYSTPAFQISQKLVSLAVSLWWMSSALIFGRRKRQSPQLCYNPSLFMVSIQKEFIVKLQ